MKYFWINIDTAKNRRNNMLRQFKENNIKDHYRVNAYLSPVKEKRLYENACCRSHLQAVAHFLLDTNDPYALSSIIPASGNVFFHSQYLLS
jgi:hypothetical protein